ncbi:MAG: RagB/SusD family nutrient uptake outer membrane protein [Tannerellaceae bacterium]
MKSLLKNILLGSLLFIASSCSDWLTESPKTFISPSSFYNSVEDFDGALKGLYPQGLNLNLTELFADYNDKPESAEQVGDIWANIPGYAFYAFRGAWSGAYSTIKNANMILLEINEKDYPQNVKDRIIGEAKCIRAFSYFNLVQLFGDVPIRMQSVTNSNDISIGRSPQADVYKLIFEDLLDAEVKLPEKSQNMGRVNKYVAKAILARVYLTSAGFPMNIKDNYIKARDKAIEVINNGGYVLMPKFDAVFKTERYTSETIWAQLFDAPTISSTMHAETAPIGSQTALYLPTDAFIESFEKGDYRKEWGLKQEYTNTKGTKVIKRTYYNKFINEDYLEQELPSSGTRILPWQTQLIRLAEMYLIAAEAENELNGPDNAYQYVNQIRKRSRMDQTDPTNLPDLKELSKDTFRQAIWQERKHELYLEGFAWYDMKRTQTFYKVQEARGDQLNVPIGVYNNTWLIPDMEILNNNISQNKEYQ